MTASNRWKSRALWALALGAGASESAAGDGGVTTVTVSAGTVNIVGDDDANGIRIIPSGNQFVIQSITGTITGTTQFDPASVGRIVFRMNGGPDQVELLLPSATIGGGIAGDMGSGSDAFVLSGATVRGDVVVDGGPDYDYFQTQFSTVSGSVLTTGHEEHRVSGSIVSGALEIDARQSLTFGSFAYISGSSIAGRTTLRGAPEIGFWESRDSTYAGRLKLIGGENDDTFVSFADTFDRGCQLGGGDGRDAFRFAQAIFGGPVEIVGGGDEDSIFVGAGLLELRGLPEPQPLTVRGNGGNDDIRIGNQFVADNNSWGHLDVNSGGGQDDVRVFEADAQKATLRTGGDRDALSLLNFEVSGRMRADGGADEDTLYGLDSETNSFGKPPQVAGFENEVDITPDP